VELAAIGSRKTGPRTKSAGSVSNIVTTFRIIPEDFIPKVMAYDLHAPTVAFRSM
jgi:hypothetical protein